MRRIGPYSTVQDPLACLASCLLLLVVLVLRRWTGKDREDRQTDRRLESFAPAVAPRSWESHYYSSPR